MIWDASEKNHQNAWMMKRWVSLLKTGLKDITAKDCCLEAHFVWNLRDIRRLTIHFLATNRMLMATQSGPMMTSAHWHRMEV